MTDATRAPLVIPALADDTSWRVENCSHRLTLERLTASTSKALHVALVLSGRYGRTRESTSAESDHLPGDHSPALAKDAMSAAVLKAYSTHVVDALRRHKANVSTFLCVSPNDEEPSSEARRQLRIVHVDRTGLVGLPEVSLARTGTAYRNHQWTRAALCFSHAVAFERSSGTRFTHFLRARPDAVWYADIPSLAAARATVAVRALSVHGGAFHKGYLPAAALVGGSCLRDAVCAYRRGACVVADDQFAVVPRVWASAYFGHCHAQRDARLRLNMPSEQSERDLYYRRWSSNEYCARYCTKCFETLSMSQQLVSGSVLGGTCTEVILTRRLQDLGVPLSVRPFAFVRAQRTNLSSYSKSC